MACWELYDVQERAHETRDVMSGDVITTANAFCDVAQCQ